MDFDDAPDVKTKSTKSAKAQVDSFEKKYRKSK